jgi:hypothetical protein
LPFRCRFTSPPATLSIQTEQPLSFRSTRGLKARITNRVKKADLLFVFAHSSGHWIEHEIAAAEDYGVPILSIIDPARLSEPGVWRRTRRIGDTCVAELRLDAPDAIIAAVRKHARPQRTGAQAATQTTNAPAEDAQEPLLQTPRDIAVRVRDRQQGRGFFSNLGRIFGIRPDKNITDRQRGQKANRIRIRLHGIGTPETA